MIDRMVAGQVPDKPHTALRDPEGRLRHEECLTRDGFDGPFTILYAVAERVIRFRVRTILAVFGLAIAVWALLHVVSVARHVLVYRTVTESTAQGSGGRAGIGVGSTGIRGPFQWSLPFRAYSAANWLAMYSVAKSPPRVPTPRPSSRSLARNFTCARMRSPEISEFWASAPAASTMAVRSLDWNMITIVLSL